MPRKPAIVRFGERKVRLYKLSQELGISPETLRWRIRKGWPTSKLVMLPHPKVPVGKTFGHWTVEGEGETRVFPRGDKAATLRVRCACGAVQDRIRYVITSGRSTSCGCATRRANRATTAAA